MVNKFNTNYTLSFCLHNSMIKNSQRISEVKICICSSQIEEEKKNSWNVVSFINCFCCCCSSRRKYQMNQKRFVIRSNWIYNDFCFVCSAKLYSEKLKNYISCNIAMCPNHFHTVQCEKITIACQVICLNHVNISLY